MSAANHYAFLHTKVHKQSGLVSSSAPTASVITSNMTGTPGKVNAILFKYSDKSTKIGTYEQT